MNTCVPFTQILYLLLTFCHICFLSKQFKFFSESFQCKQQKAQHFFPRIFQCVPPKNKDISLITILLAHSRQLLLIKYYYLIYRANCLNHLQNVLSNFYLLFYPRPHQRSQIASGNHVFCLFPFHLKLCPCCLFFSFFFLSFITLTFLKNPGQSPNLHMTNYLTNYFTRFRLHYLKYVFIDSRKRGRGRERE